MSPRQSIVCIGTPSWDGEYAKSTVFLLTELAKEFTILYVEYQFTIKDAVAAIVGKQQAPVKRMLGVEPRLRTLSLENGATIHVLTVPPVIPANWIPNAAAYGFLQQFNAALILPSITSAMEDLGLEEPILLNAFNPSFGHFLSGSIRHSLLAYYCYDNIDRAHWLGVHGGRMEQEFARHADVIITSSDELTKRFSGMEEKVRVVKNGVDFQLMMQGYTLERNVERPVIGYVGSIDSRLDTDMMEEVIIRSPQWDFHFIGRVVDTALAMRLEKHANVHFNGPVAPRSLPEKIREMDVCIIPFAVNEFNRSVYPLKVNEYLAAGKPVIKTPFADLPEFNGVTETAGTAVEFCNAISYSLEFDSDVKRQQRREFASRQSWQHRASDFSNILSIFRIHKAATATA